MEYKRFYAIFVIVSEALTVEFGPPAGDTRIAGFVETFLKVRISPAVNERSIIPVFCWNVFD